MMSTAPSEEKHVLWRPDASAHLAPAAEDALACVRVARVERLSVLRLPKELVGQHVAPQMEGRSVWKMLHDAHNGSGGCETLAEQTGRRHGSAVIWGWIATCSHGRQMSLAQRRRRPIAAELAHHFRLRFVCARISID